MENKPIVVCDFQIRDKLLNEILKLEPTQSIDDFIKFFIKDIVYIVCIFDKIEDYELGRHTLLNLLGFDSQVLVKAIDLDEVVQYWNKIIYKIKINKSLGMHTNQIMYFHNLARIFYSEKIGSELVNINPSFKEWSYKGNTKNNHCYIFSNNHLLLETDFEVNRYIDIFQNKINNFNKKSDKKKRTPFTKSIRLEVFKRDKYKCKICGNSEPLEIDHILPHSLGGTDDMENLQTLCKPCNRSKSHRIYKRRGLQ